MVKQIGNEIEPCSEKKFSIFTQSQFLMTPTYKPFGNIVQKGENAGNQHFLLFPQCFLPFLKQISIFLSQI